MALSNLQIDSNLSPKQTSSESLPAGVVPEPVSLIKKTRRDPLAYSLWLSTFVCANNSILKLLAAKGMVAGSALPTIQLITVAVEVGLAVFLLVAVSAYLASKVISDFRDSRIGYSLPLLIANVILAGSTIFIGFNEPSNLATRQPMEDFSVFALLFSAAIFMQSKGGRLFRSAAPSRLCDIAPTGTVVRPMDKFQASEAASQGILFPPEETVVVPSASLRVGDIIRIKEGEVAPCDGVVTEGSAVVEERKYLGNTNLRTKERGQEIFGGSRVSQGSLLVKIGLTQSESLGATFDPQMPDSGDNAPITSNSYLTSLVNLTVVFAAMLAGTIAAYETASPITVASVMGAILSLCLLAVPLELVGEAKIAMVSKAFSKGILIKGLGILNKLMKPRIPVFGSDPLTIFRDSRAKVLDIMDSRVDRKSLGNVVLTLSLRAENPIFRELSRFLIAKESISPSSLQVEDFSEYDGRGISGIISGTEITLGFEDFLIDRGVHLQSSDLTAQGGGQALFVAIGADIVARIIFENLSNEFKTQGVDPLKARGIRAVLLGSSMQSALDVQGQRLGFELSSIFGGLDAKTSSEKISSLGDILLFGGEALLGSWDGDNGNSNAVSVSVFDERGASGSDGDVVVFNRGAEVLTVLNAVGEKLSWAGKEARVFAALCCLLGLFSTIWLGVSPVVPALISILGIGYAYLWPMRFSTCLGNGNRA